MKVSQIGEFGLIDRLNKMVDAAGLNLNKPDLLIGIGDDAAAWKCSGKIQLVTVDSFVQGVHFTLETASWREIGWKSLAINLSDIAAMGGAPRYALIALSLPQDTGVEDVVDMYRGIIDLAGKFDVAIVGGNISGAAVVSVTITVIGDSTDNQVLKRSSAKPGDAVAVTGWPGSAAAGLAMLAQKLEFGEEDAAYFRRALLRPMPRIAEGQILASHGIAAAIDTSDGLLSDLRHICESSRVGAHIYADSMPVHEMLKKDFGEKALGMALSGGEDYELLFTGNIDSIRKIKNKLKHPVGVIGEITSGKTGKIELVDAAGNPLKIKESGWTHF